MPLEQQSRDDTIILRPTGRLDQAAARELDEATKGFAEQEDLQLVVDLSAVTHIASIGAKALLDLQQAVAAHDGTVILAGADENVSATLGATGLLALCPPFATVDDAVDHFR